MKHRCCGLTSTSSCAMELEVIGGEGGGGSMLKRELCSPRNKKNGEGK